MARDVRSIERGRGLLSMRIEIELDNVIIRMRSKAPCSSCERAHKASLAQCLQGSEGAGRRSFLLERVFSPVHLQFATHGLIASWALREN